MRGTEIRQRPSPFSLSTAQAVEREKGENEVVFRLPPVETVGYESVDPAGLKTLHFAQGDKAIDNSLRAQAIRRYTYLHLYEMTNVAVVPTANADPEGRRYITLFHSTHIIHYPLYIVHYSSPTYPFATLTNKTSSFCRL